MTLQNIISEKVRRTDINDLAKTLGYQSPYKLSSRINKITNNPYLALDHGTYDFHESTPSFIC